jgi:hypothetical protein
MPSISQQDEFDLVCALATADLNVSRATRFRESDLSAVDWAEVVRLTEHHNVLPLAARELIEDRCDLPEDVKNSLRSAYDMNVRRNLWFGAELVRIMHELDSVGVRAIPFKGPLLTQMLYDDGLRSFTDLDILIAPSELERAKNVLVEIGYHPAQEIDPTIERFWLRNGYERAFGNSVAENLVELQWALLPRFYAVDLRVEDLIARAATVNFGGAKTACLAPEDLLVALCLHAAKHLWTRLIWIVDIAELLRKQSIDYAVVNTRARELGILRIVSVSLWLVKNVLGVELDPQAETLIAADLKVAELGREFSKRLIQGEEYNFESTKYFWLIMMLRERRWDRWRYLWRLVWIPGTGDLAAVRLPEGLFFLYRVIRLGRLMGKLVQ